MAEYTRSSMLGLWQFTALCLMIFTLENPLVAMITAADTFLLPDQNEALTGLKAGVSREITPEHNPPSHAALRRGSCRFHPRAKSSGFSATANKRVTLLADCHGASPQGAQQLEAFVACLLKLREPLHILVEQPPALYYRFAKLLGLLTGITKKIQECKASSITTENIEIRPIAWAAHYILSRQRTDSLDPHSRCNQHDKHSLEEITFQHMIDEYDANKTMLQTAFHPIEQKSIKDNYAQYIQKATDALKRLNKMLQCCQIAPASPILAYKIRTGATDTNKSLAQLILDTSSPLLELNILHKIIARSHKNLAIVAGYKHTSELATMLLDAHAQQIYSIGSPLNTTPITAEQFTTALTRRPYVPLTTCVIPLACCTITMLIWYYYCASTTAT